MCRLPSALMIQTAFKFTMSQYFPSVALNFHLRLACLQLYIVQYHQERESSEYRSNVDAASRLQVALCET